MIISTISAYTQKYGIYRHGGAIFADDSIDIFLDAFQLEPGDRFVYNYNYSENHVHDILTEAVESIDQDQRPPGIGGKRLTSLGSWAPPELLFEPISSAENLTVGELIEKLTFIAEYCKPPVFSTHGFNQRLIDAGAL